LFRKHEHENGERSGREEQCKVCSSPGHWIGRPDLGDSTGWDQRRRGSDKGRHGLLFDRFSDRFKSCCGQDRRGFRGGHRFTHGCMANARSSYRSGEVELRAPRLDFQVGNGCGDACRPDDDQSGGRRGLACFGNGRHAGAGIEDDDLRVRPRQEITKFLG
jgi:hypothetical protein